MIIEDAFVSFVNLDHRKDRLTRMLATLKRVGLAATRTKGLTETDRWAKCPRVATMYRRTPGAIGCHFSQLSIMREAVRQRKHAFVMEDDLIFCSDFWQRMAVIEAFTETHPWDIFWLGGTFHVNPPWWHKKDLGRDAETTDNPWIMRTYGAFCTYAYIVNRDSIEKVLGLCDEWLPKSIGIDWLMIQIQPVLNTFAFVPGCITQYDGKSDIGKGNTIFSNFARLGPWWFQDKLEGFDPEGFDWHEAKAKAKP